MTGPGSSPSNVPDLAALREKAENADGHVVLLTADSLLAVLSLVDRLQEYVDANEASFAASERVHAGDAEPASMARYLARLEAARAALGLAGSPAANEEQQ